MPSHLPKLLDDAPKDLGGNDVHTLPSLSGLSKLGGNGCIYLHTIRDLPRSLKFLYAGDCPALETMPNFSEMSNMRELDVSDSHKLTEVSGLDKSLNSMAWIDMKRCSNLTTDFRKNILQVSLSLPLSLPSYRAHTCLYI